MFHSCTTSLDYFSLFPTFPTSFIIVSKLHHILIIQDNLPPLLDLCHATGATPIYHQASSHAYVPMLEKGNDALELTGRDERPETHDDRNCCYRSDRCHHHGKEVVHLALTYAKVSERVEEVKHRVDQKEAASGRHHGAEVVHTLLECERVSNHVV